MTGKSSPLYGDVPLIGLTAGWDLWRRRPLNPAFAIGAVLLLASQLVANAIYMDAGWKRIATAIVRAWGYGG